MNGHDEEDDGSVAMLVVGLLMTAASAIAALWLLFQFIDWVGRVTQ